MLGVWQPYTGGSVNGPLLARLRGFHAFVGLSVLGSAGKAVWFQNICSITVGRRLSWFASLRVLMIRLHPVASADWPREKLSFVILAQSKRLRPDQNPLRYVE